MTTPVQGPEPTAPVTDPTTQQNDPPYKAYLDEIPEALRPQVEEAFKKWDGDVTQRFQSLHSEIDPYKAVIDEYEPTAIEQAINIVKLMDDNPEEFLRQYIQATGLTPEQGTAVTPTPSQTVTPPVTPLADDPYAPKFAELEQGLAAITQMLQGQQQQSVQQQQQQQLEGILQGLHTKHGDFDDIYVLTMLGNGLDPEAAVGQWKSTLNKYGVSANALAPTVVSASNGGHAVEQISAEDLASGKVKSADLVAQMLKIANES